MKYIAMLLVAISVVPALALPSDDYIISDQNSQINVIIQVTETSAQITDVFVNGMDSTLTIDRISNNGEVSKIFGKSGDNYFYIIYDLGNQTFKTKIWDSSGNTRIISTPIVESLF